MLCDTEDLFTYSYTTEKEFVLDAKLIAPKNEFVSSSVPLIATIFP